MLTELVATKKLILTTFSLFMALHIVGQNNSTKIFNNPQVLQEKNSFYHFLLEDFEKFKPDSNYSIAFGAINFIITNTKVDSIYIIGNLPKEIEKKVRNRIFESSKFWQFEKDKTIHLVQHIFLNYSFSNTKDAETFKIGNVLGYIAISESELIGHYDGYFQRDNKIMLMPIQLDNHIKR